MGSSPIGRADEKHPFYVGVFLWGNGIVELWYNSDMKNKKKGFILPIIISIIAILVFGVSVYIYSENNKLNDINKNENQNDIYQKIITECSDSKDKEKCLSDKAISLKDRNVCDLIPSAKEYCLGSYGMNFNDVATCDLLSDNPGTQTKDICYEQVAKKINDSQVCEKLDAKGWYYRQCYGDAAFRTKDKSLCEKTADYKEYCIKGIENGVQWTDYRN